MIKNPELKAVRGGAVRLTLSANIANDLGALQKGLKDLAEHMGHPSCNTGCDVFHIGMEREFVINAKAELNPQPLPPVGDSAFSDRSRLLPQDPVPMVTVSVPSNVLADIGKLQEVAASVLGKLGCSACCSGFDIEFRRQLEQFRVDEKLNVERLANVG
jgi:hypothetical protein